MFAVWHYKYVINLACNMLTSNSYMLMYKINILKKFSVMFMKTIALEFNHKTLLYEQHEVVKIFIKILLNQNIEKSRGQII